MRQQAVLICRDDDAARRHSTTIIFAVDAARARRGVAEANDIATRLLLLLRLRFYYVTSYCYGLPFRHAAARTDYAGCRCLRGL